MQYLIVKCEALSDQYECDADRTPLCITDDFNLQKYNKVGNEVYKILPNGKLELIKDYEIAGEEGIAIYSWDKDSNCENTPPNKIYVKYKGENRDDFTKSRIKKIKSEYNFTDTVDEIYRSVHECGQYGEEIGDEWIVIGEYSDDCFSVGY